MNGIKQFSLSFSFFFILLLAILPACKDDFNSSIPYVRVNRNISLTNHNALNVPGVPVYINGGYGGIIIIYTGFSYYAYDGACPYEADFDCRLEDDGDVIGTCSCCGTQYNLMEGGYVISGPSAEPLQQYNVNPSGNQLYITNR